MGASSSGLLDEAKISHIKGLADSTFQSFSAFYRQQYSVAYLGHLHQEVEPKREGRGLLLTHRPQYAPDEVLYQGTVKFSSWDEQLKKCRERYIVLRRDYRAEIHDSMETFSRGCAAKLVLQLTGAAVFTNSEESKAHLEKACAGILNGVKEDSSSLVFNPDAFAVHLHLPYRGHTCFLFHQEEERDHFLSSLKTCIRHRNLDPWCNPSYESQAYTRALRLYRQEKGCYESWEMLLGTEEQVLASQVMEEVLPWLQSQLQSRLKGKKTERIRLWLATAQATYTLVLETLTAGLEALKEECRQTASNNQALIRSNLDQIMSSHSFLEQKVRACVCEEAEKVCSESVAPYMSSILEALTENISAGILGMQRTLNAQMDSAFSHTNERTEETKKALSGLHSIRLDQSYKQVENLTEKLEGLKDRFGLSSTHRLVHYANLEMEQLLDSAVYTLEQFLQSSSRLQPSQVPVKLNRATERVLKQLDYDSRVVQRRLYEEALLEITLPTLTRKMDSKWKTELQQFEQYIFSDYSGFILVHNVYDDVLRTILSKEIETAVQDAASKKSNNLLLDTSDLAISQYSLLGQTPPRSAPDSPAADARQSSSAVLADDQETVSAVEEKSQTADACPQSNEEGNADAESDQTPVSGQSAMLLSPVIVVTQQVDEAGSKEALCLKETREEAQVTADASSTEPAEPTKPTEPAKSNNSDADEVSAPEPSAEPGPTITDSLDVSPLVSPQTTEVQVQSESAVPDDSVSNQPSEEDSPIQSDSPLNPPDTDAPMKLSLGSLSEAITCSSLESSGMPIMGQQTTDRAVYLTGGIKDSWEVERVKEEKRKEEAERNDTIKAGGEQTEKEEVTGEETGEETMEAQTGGEPVDDSCRSSGSPVDTATSNTEQRESKERMEEGGTSGELRIENKKDDDEEAAAEKEDHVEEEKEEEEKPMESQLESAAEPPLDSVSCIRDLVAEIIEVETTVTPCPESSSKP
ncbi:protein Niban 1-like [Archocentrus centrarchus]|uniref:protein Niban 1-like n=1 Tax=Archocentrus centrarchus TaxID=63155 RepID=UPI0011E9FD4A|nr:protein Niban 1-like [Archocentrus centrarchus]